jgi:hypothetical protein
MNPRAGSIGAPEATRGGGTTIGRRGRAHPPRRPVPLVAAVLVALVAAGVYPLVPPSLPASALAGPAPPMAPAIGPYGNGPCGGPHEPATYTGTLGVEGGSSPPSVANRTVRALFAYQLDYTPNGGTTTTSCSTGSATAATDAQGRFSLTLSLLPSGCSPGGCSNYSGPFGPVSFDLTNTTPAGYFVAANVSGSTLSIDYVVALGSAGLSPFGRTTVSALAPVALTASGVAGNGAPSPAALTYDWVVSGVGWAVVAGDGTDQLTVVSAAGAGPGQVTVFVNGTFGGATESAAPRSATLTAVATTIVAESVSPTQLDAGTPATFTITGSGAAGYPYTATVFPGLGVGPVSEACAESPAMGGLVTLSCAVLVTYGSAGVAQPSANLTNGYSSATSTTDPFPAVDVAPGLLLWLTPSPAFGYVGSPIGYTVRAASGTGTAPLGPACFWPGNGALSCGPAGRTSWSFNATFGRPGSYAGVATVADAAGANRSVTGITLVVEAPSLSPIGIATSLLNATMPYAVSSVYGGGALPAAYWWNDSLPQGTVARGVLSADGPLTLTYRPPVAGVHVLTLTVVDGLGTVSAQLVRLTVVAGPAAAIVPVGPPGGFTTVAGTPYNLSWAVVDAAGDIVPTASPAFSLAPLGPAGPVWVNRTGGGPILPGPTGAYVVNRSDWQGGVLNVSIDPGAAGTVRFALTSALPVSGAPNGTIALHVAYDHFHLRLVDPVFAPVMGENHTRWRISDRFDNPVPNGYVVVTVTEGGATSHLESPVLFNGSVSVVWVNFTTLAGEGLSIVVQSAWGQTLLAPISVPAAPSASVLELAALVALAAAAVVCLVVGARARPRAAAASVRDDRPPDERDDPDLRRLATGRAFVLSRADPTTPRDLADLVRGFPGIPPTPTELAEWVGSLVNEGTLKAALGPDGRPRFTRRRPDEPVPPGPDGPPRVELDPAALEAALQQREEPAAEDGEDEPGTPDP